MDSYTIRAELKKLEKRELFELTWQQKKGWCNIGASECGFFIQYKGFHFCLTELLGQGCSAQLEQEDLADGRDKHPEECHQLLIPELWHSHVE